MKRSLEESYNYYCEEIRNYGSELLTTLDEFKEKVTTAKENGSWKSYNVIKIDVKCISCNKKYETKFSNMSQKSNLKMCNECVLKNKTKKLLSLDYIKNKSIKYGLKFVRIEGKYKSNTTCNLIYECLNCGKEYNTSWATIQSNKKRKFICDECMKQKMREKFQLSYDDVKEYIEQYNCKLLSNTYINSHTYLDIECLTCGNIFTSSLDNFKATKHKCLKCAIESKREIQKTDIIYVKKYIEKEGYKLLSEYINCDTDLKLMCPKGHIFYMDFYHFKNRGQRCKVCFKLTGRSGENSGTWKGGITSLQRSMRACIAEWVKESMLSANFTCQITGKKGRLNVHHTYPFHKILEETLIELDLDLKPTIGEYSQDEFEKMKILIIQKHDDYDCSFVMLESIHKLFHDTYGRKNTTKEQLEEFIIRYKSNEFTLN